MDWNFNATAPIFLQITEKIKLAIVNGTFKPGEKLPSVREFAEAAGVNPNTVQRTFSSLEAESLIVTEGTFGRFVTKDETVISQVKRHLAENYVNELKLRLEKIGVSSQEARLLIDEIYKEDNK